MAQHEEIVLWLDRRWKNAIEKHLKGETLQEHLETVLDELCNQLPQREYERISRAIQSEAAAQRAEEEAARTYAAYHVTECGQEWYFKTSPGEELLAVGKKLRGYITKDNGVAPGKFIGMFFGGQPITAKEFDALTALRMENIESDGKLNFYLQADFDVDAAFGTFVCTDQNDDWLNIYANYDVEQDCLCDTMELNICKGDGSEESWSYPLNAAEQEVLLSKMEAFCQQQTGMSLHEYAQQLQDSETQAPEMQM